MLTKSCFALESKNHFQYPKTFVESYVNNFLQNTTIISDHDFLSEELISGSCNFLAQLG